MNATSIARAARFVLLLSVPIGLAGGAHADTPLSLSLTETLQHDTNILRDNAARQSDTVSSTGLTLALDKSYGRQRYQASLQGVLNRYSQLKNYDNTGYNLSLGASTTAASNVLLSANVEAVQQLQRPEDQQGRRIKETIDTRTARLYGQYGLYGRWSGNLSATSTRVNFKRSTDQDKQSNGVRLGGRYSPTDLLYFESGYQRSKVDSPGVFLANGRQGDTIDRDDVDFNTRWVVTGMSQLSARIGYTQERSANDVRRDFNGITGSANWSYTPAGRLSYSLNAARDTNNSGGVSFGTAAGSTFLTRNLLTTTLGAGVRWELSSKLAASAGATFQRIEDDTTVGFSGVTTNVPSRGNYRMVNLGLNYQYSRALSLGCRFEKYARTVTRRSPAFDGNDVSCTGSFTLD